MSVLAASGFGIANFARLPEDAPVWQEQSRALWQSLAFHFEHPVWDSKFGLMGVSAWDLIQPAFMFMVGTAMPFSDARRRAEGQSALNRWSHALLRAVVLVLLGVFLYSLRSERTNWIFTNVLAQIGLGYFFAYVLLGRRDWFQWTALAAVLGGYWWFFQQYELPQGYDLAAVSASAEKGEVFEGKSAPWSKNANAAHAFDVMFLNLLRHPPEAELQAAGAAADATSWAPDWLRQIAFNNTEVFQFNSGGYQTLNFVPSIGTTLLGILCGQLIQRRKKSWRVFGMLLAWGALCMVLGLAAAEFACPIVKRIWTPSWVLFSGAYVIWILAACYALFDLLPLRWLAFPLAVVGMNSLAMYLMGQLMHGWTRDNVVGPHLNGLLQTMFGAAALGDDMYGRLIEPTAVFVVFWLIAYWMFRQRYFLRI
jgi:predicted acyltransferase